MARKRGDPARITTPGNQALATALYQQGKSVRQVAVALRCSPAGAWRLKHHADSVDSDTLHAMAGTLADRMVHAASLAVDVFHEQAYSGRLNEETPLAVAKAAGVLLCSAGSYAALSGSKDIMAQLVDQYGIAPSHTAHSVTVTQAVTLTSGAASKTIEAEVTLKK